MRVITASSKMQRRLADIKVIIHREELPHGATPQEELESIEFGIPDEDVFALFVEIEQPANFRVIPPYNSNMKYRFTSVGHVIFIDIEKS